MTTWPKMNSACFIALRQMIQLKCGALNKFYTPGRTLPIQMI